MRKAKGHFYSSIRGLATPWTYFIHLSRSFWLTFPRGVQSTSWCCPSRPCLAFLACMHLALFLALSLSPCNSLVSSLCDHCMLASLLWRCLSLLSTKPAESFSVLSSPRRQDGGEYDNVAERPYMCTILRLSPPSSAGSHDVPVLVRCRRPGCPMTTVQRSPCLSVSAVRVQSIKSTTTTLSQMDLWKRPSLTSAVIRLTLFRRRVRDRPAIFGWIYRRVARWCNGRSDWKGRGFDRSSAGRSAFT